MRTSCMGYRNQQLMKRCWATFAKVAITVMAWVGLYLMGVWMMGGGR